jgi:hypothetical protein
MVMVIFWTHFVTGYQIRSCDHSIDETNIRKPDHSTCGHKVVIQIPDSFGTWTVTVIGFNTVLWQAQNNLKQMKNTRLSKHAFAQPSHTVAKSLIANGIVAIQ